MFFRQVKVATLIDHLVAVAQYQIVTHDRCIQNCVRTVIAILVTHFVKAYTEFTIITQVA